MPSTHAQPHPSKHPIQGSMHRATQWARKRVGAEAPASFLPNQPTNRPANRPNPPCTRRAIEWALKRGMFTKGQGVAVMHGASTPDSYDTAVIAIRDTAI
jgi:hypothetical protein